MAKKHGNIYVKDVIPKDTYKGMTADNPQASVTNLLTVHQNMDDKTAYAIVKAVFENKIDMVRVHAESINIKMENQKTSSSPIPWHPGALKYYAEKGIKMGDQVAKK
jgi:TRAP transporter TAXI family solute receptor